MAVAGAISAAERSIRSVFVGNIPFDATEEKLKDLFSEVGPVISFRLVYDRDSGKPKGYGFCEYFDAETASSALRNLNGYELNGRAIRVDNAANERNREELKNFQMSTPVLPSESPYGAECSPDKAPEAISKAVASLPPEQMFELMKQMKHCIQNNPNEARNMLLQNPQLAYALLQAQVVMKIVDPQVALTMLHRPNTAVQPIMPASNVVEVVPAASVPTGTTTAAVTITKPVPNPISNVFPEVLKGPTAVVVNPPPVPVSGPRGPLPPQGEFIRGPANAGVGNPFMDPRAQQFEPRDPRNMHFDPRGGPGVRPPSMMRPPMMMPPPRELMRDPRDMNRGDPRAMPHDMDIRPPPHFEPRLRGMDPRNIRGPPEFDQRSMGPMLRPRFPDRGGFDPRSPIYVDQRDPRSQAVPSPVRPLGPPRTGGGGGPPLPSSQSPQQAGGGQDQEKAALIMQVLQLSDQQIALLPPEQRQSIMVLKEQIARSAENQK